MTTNDFKNKIQKSPESSYISYYLQQFMLLSNSNDLLEYFNKIKNIENVDDVQELYKIKGQILLLKSSCAHIVELIDKLDFHITEEFEDITMTLEEIGINEGDKFQCITDYLHWDQLLIKKGSIISIEHFKYLGNNSLFSTKIEQLITDEQNQEHLKELAELPLILNYKELGENFKKI